MARILLLLMVVAPPSVCLGQVHTEGARAVALAGAVTALSGEAWGAGNPASWATVAQHHFAAFGSQAYGLEELRRGSILYVHPSPWGAFAARASTFGFAAYRETVLVAGYSRSFSLGTTRSLHGGLALRYRHVRLAAPYGATGSLALSVGWLVRLLPTLQAAFHAGSLAAGWRQEAPSARRSLALGFCYRPAASMRVLADLYKEARWPLALRAGIEVQPVRSLFLRIGLATAPMIFSGGAGLHLGRVRASLAAQHHLALGWSPALSFGVAW